MKNQEGSELARLLRRIDEENEAAHNALYGMADGVAKHEFITARLERIGQLHEELCNAVGPEEAARLVVEVLDRKGK